MSKEPKVLICMPNTGTILNKTVASLISLDKPEESKYCLIGGSLIYDARDICVTEAINGEFSHLMFIDSDIEFLHDGLMRLLEHDVDICTGVYYKRGGDHSPVVYRDIQPLSYKREVTCETETDIDREWFEVKGCGMGFCLIKTEVFKKILKDYPSCFKPIDGLGEDLSFCWRATQKGYKIYADGTIPLNHWGMIAFGRASWNKEKC